jgi:uncharacterized membrane protein YfcA
MTSENETVFLIVFAIVAFLIGLSKGGLGGTLGAVATPMMALVMPASLVIGLLLPVLMFADIFAVAFHWRRWDRRLIILLLPGAIVGVTIATFFITNAPTELLQKALGIVILIFGLYKLLEKRIMRGLRYQSRKWHGLLAGTIAGVSSGLAHTGGPPVSIYLLMQGITPRVFIATSALFFMLLNWIKVPYYFYARLFDFRLLWHVAWILIVVPIGVWIGRRMAGHFNVRTFERVITVILLANALLLIF